MKSKTEIEAEEAWDELAEEVKQDFITIDVFKQDWSFIKGFDAGREYELNRAKVLVEALKDLQEDNELDMKYWELTDNALKAYLGEE